MLNDEIDAAKRSVRTDAYQISVGEIVSMYKNKELVINPDFQRLFRWELGRKAKLIESILLGIPVPSIFVFEKEDATWELIDGLQRVATLLEFMGELVDTTTGDLSPPIALVATKYLPSLHNAVWEASEDIADVPLADQRPFLGPQQLAIRRSRLSVEILKRPSENATKYDLFQRLNAGGISANAQELRNSIVLMVNETYGVFLRGLSDSPEFRNVLNASDDQLEKQRHMEYVCRLLVHTFLPYDGKLDVEEFIDEGIVQLATANETHVAASTFNSTFNLLEETFGSNALRRFQNGVPAGRIGLQALEGVAVGIAKNIDSIRRKPSPTDYVRQRIVEFWAAPEVASFYVSGMRGTTRIQRTVPFGAAWFAT